MLPAEIRNRIYGFRLRYAVLELGVYKAPLSTSDEMVAQWFTQSMSEYSTLCRKPHSPQRICPLLLVNKQMTAEVIAVFYDLTTFVFPGPCVLNWFLENRASQCALIREVKLFMVESMLEPPYFPRLHTIVHLRLIHIEISRSGIQGGQQRNLRSLERRLQDLKSWVNILITYVSRFSSPRLMSAEEIREYSFPHCWPENRNGYALPDFWHRAPCVIRRSIQVRKTSVWLCRKGMKEWSLGISKIDQQDTRRLHLRQYWNTHVGEGID